MWTLLVIFVSFYGGFFMASLLAAAKSDDASSLQPHEWDTAAGSREAYDKPEYAENKLKLKAADKLDLSVSDVCIPPTVIGGNRVDEQNARRSNYERCLDCALFLDSQHGLWGLKPKPSRDGLRLHRIRKVD